MSENTKKLLYYNAGILNRLEGGNTEFKVVYDTSKSSQAIVKHCGGMRIQCDLNPTEWLEKMRYLLNDYGFSAEQIEVITAHEFGHQANRSTGKRSAMREILEEIGVYALEVKVVFKYRDHTFDGNHINKVFWHIEKYIQPEFPRDAHRSRDNKIMAIDWLTPNVLLTPYTLNSIISTHRRATELAVKIGKISEEVTIESLAEFA